MKQLRVALKDRAYSIVIGKGSIHQTGKLLRAFDMGRKVFVVTNRKIARTAKWWAPIKASLLRSGFTPVCYELPFGSEKDKSEYSLLKLWGAMAKAGLDRRSFVLALGGGVVGDMAGFAASTYMRGISLIQVPTTLLAQVDSSIGGKTGIDLKHAKNMVGTFYQPRLVISDPQVIMSADLNSFRDSFAEVIKYGVIKDPQLFNLVERRAGKFLSNLAAGRLASSDFSFVEKIVYQSARIKAEVVEKDEQETRGLRAILNYGHTFAHTLEGASRYGISHGKAVGIGMMMAAELAFQRGSINAGFVSRQNKLIQKLVILQNPVSILKRYRITWKKVKPLLFHDKKASSGMIRFILPKRLGAVEIVQFYQHNLTKVQDTFRKFGVT